MLGQFQAPPLPSPPLIESLLFESPWPVVIGLVAAAFIAVVVGNQRAKLAAGLGTGLALLGLGVGVWMTASVVETTRETLQRGTRLLVQAVDQGDGTEAGRYMADTVRTRRYPGDRDWERTEFETLIGTAARAGIDELEITALQAHLDGSQVGRTQVRVRARSQNGVTMPSWWLLHWQNPDGNADNPLGGWRIVTIEAVAVPGVLSADD